MPDQYNHLDLPLFPQQYERQSGRPPRFVPRSVEEKAEYLSVQTQQLGEIQRNFQVEKNRFRDFIDPNLIFKLEITQPVSEESLRTELRRMEIDVLASSPAKRGGLWVVFAADEALQSFQVKLRSYVERDQYGFFNAIGRIIDIPAEEKFGDRLRVQPLASGEAAYLDMEIWRMEDERLNQFLNELTRLITTGGGSVTDRLITNNFCLLRVRLSGETLDEILSLREIASVDRPPRPYIDFTLLNTPLEAVAIGDPPPREATAIAVLDSGIFAGHPLLQNAVGDEIAMGTRYSDRIREDQVADEVGHGTKVAGVALYGDLKACIEQRAFRPEVWILSAKVMYAEENPITGQREAKYDEEELLEHQLEQAVRGFKRNYPNCRVVNLSLGDEYKRMFGQQRQFNLAALVDELARELKLLFVVATGNFNGYDQRGFPDTYPNYLLEETDEVKLIDPATAALALTVGALAPPYGPLNRAPADLFFSPADTHYPSPFTRVGPGYQDMIKPELVEEGGNIIRDRRELPDRGGELVTLNPRWLNDGRLFTVDYGTSFSTPKVAHYVARLFNQYPQASPNLIKALLLASAQIPADRPDPLDRIDLAAADDRLIDLLKVYGYGKPNFEQARFSTDRSVVLLRENSLHLDGVHVYYFYLPDEFIQTAGRKRLTVTLAYDPPVNKNRLDYLGCAMTFRLFKNMEVDEAVRAYSAIRVAEVDDEEITPISLRLHEMPLHPKSNLRKRGVHQKGVVEYPGRPRFDLDKPLVLAVVCQNRWIRERQHLQDYAIVVMVEHTASVDLFNRLRARNQERLRAALR